MAAVVAVPNPSHDRESHAFLRNVNHMNSSSKLLEAHHEKMRETRMPPGTVLGVASVALTLVFLVVRLFFLRIMIEAQKEKEENDDDEESSQSEAAGQAESVVTGASSAIESAISGLSATTFFTDQGTSLINIKGVKHKFHKLSDRSELDFYSCLGLALGRFKFSSKTLKFLPGVVCVCFMQILMGVMLLLIQMDGGNMATYSDIVSWKFRMIGFLLFVFSAWRITGGMDDECRELLLRCMERRRVPMWYAMPILLGEIMNKFIGIILMAILFMIFCLTRRPTSLLMNCLAVNFLVDVDTYLVSEDDAEEASENLEVALAEWNQIPEERSMGFQTMIRKQVLFVSEAMRIAYPFVVCFLVLVFALGNNEALCQQMQEIDPWPYCLGINAKQRQPFDDFM